MATQRKAAREGIVTPQMEAVAREEGTEVQELRELVAEGKVAIPANHR
ncbi:MAG: phosphomethylpyrimidine synthase ThiC, partial [Clostridia bacterium]